MKKVFFSGKFNKSSEFCTDIVKGLENDFRARLLGNSEKMVYPSDNIKINDKYYYVGPFWYERGETGVFSDKDYKIVVSEEAREISICDVFVVVLNEGSVGGSICELGWALNQNKDIYILYEIQDSICDIKSEHWFAIADAMRRSEKVRLFPYENSNEILPIINSILE